MALALGASLNALLTLIVVPEMLLMVLVSTKPFGISAEIKSHKAAQEDAARQVWRTHPAYLAERARFAERLRAGVMPGRAAMEFVRDAVQAADAARQEIAHRFAVSVFCLM